MSQSVLALGPALSFHETTFNVIDRDGQYWLQAADIARALGYQRSDSVNRIYVRRLDEFTERMCQTVKLTVSQNKGKLQRETCIFSLRGAHLVAMFARTPIAKEFRRWVLDILDREVAQPANPARSVVTHTEAKDMREQIEVVRQQLAMVESKLSKWEIVDDTPPPNPYLEATVKQVIKLKGGDWSMYVNCGGIGLSVKVEQAMMQPGGVKPEDRVHIEYKKGDNPLCGPYTMVRLATR